MRVAVREPVGFKARRDQRHLLDRYDHHRYDDRNRKGGGQAVLAVELGQDPRLGDLGDDPVDECYGEDGRWYLAKEECRDPLRPCSRDAGEIDDRHRRECQSGD